MRTVTIKAIEAVRCIRSGMTDAALMDQLGVSSGGLRRLFQQLLAAGLVTKDEMEDRLTLSHASVIVGTEKKSIEVQSAKKPMIDAADAINCIRSGMDDSILMKRYNLSVKGVQSLFEKLVAAGLITWTEIERRSHCYQQSLVLDEEAGPTAKKRTKLEESDATEILRRLRYGGKYSDILDEYEISRSRLCQILGEMAERGLATPGELEAYLAEPSMHFQIRRRVSGGLIYSGSTPSIGALVEMAVKEGIDLSDSDLSSLNLAHAELCGAVLIRADLRRSNLIGADLTGAKLTEATLASANMTGATMCKANLAGADLSDANLSHVNGAWAFLAGANLSETNLTNADLSGANLSGAQMFETILRGTILTGAYLKTPTLDRRSE